MKNHTEKNSLAGRVAVRPLVLTLVITLALGGFWAFQRYGDGLLDRLKKFPVVQGLLGLQPELEERLVPEGAQEESKRLLVRVYKTARGEFKDFLPVIGVVKSLMEVDLKFATEGTIQSLNFQEGDVVRKGDLLGMLDQRDANLKLEFNQAKLKTAKTQELAAKKKLDLHKQLYEIGVIIRPKLEEVAIEYETTKSQTLQAQKEVAFANAEFEKTYLYNPMNGIMGKRESEVGEVVSATVEVATVYDISNVYAEVGITEKDINRVQLGQNMRITVDAYQGREFSGKIESISPIIEGKSRTLAVKASLQNEQGELLPGMFIRSVIYVFEAANTIMIPNRALYDLDEDGSFDSVYVISPENATRIRKIDMGYVSTDFVQITRGLREDELVVVEAQGQIEEELPVEIIEVQESGF
jgi:membrane fusion protein, multidrug efflux system